MSKIFLSLMFILLVSSSFANNDKISLHLKTGIMSGDEFILPDGRVICISIGADLVVPRNIDIVLKRSEDGILRGEFKSYRRVGTSAAQYKGEYFLAASRSLDGKLSLSYGVTIENGSKKNSSNGEVYFTEDNEMIFPKLVLKTKMGCANASLEISDIDHPILD